MQKLKPRHFKPLTRSLHKLKFSKPYVTLDQINQNLIHAEYQVRGITINRASEIANDMKNGVKYPFDKLVQLNIGNPQALDQKPLTFPREVMSCVFSNLATNKDAMHRSEYYKREILSVEGLTNFLGMSIVRKNIARFIQSRDKNCEVTKDDIILSNGASGGIRLVLESLLNPGHDAVMVPIPQYPLYSALIRLMGCELAGYYLDEENEWSLDINNVLKVFKDFYDRNLNLKVLVVINPGNPTGNVLSEDNIKETIKFCYEHKMAIIADEVYQNNVYVDDKEFISFRKVLHDMGHPYNQTMLFSFNSVSKGYYGECGLRGGYLDMCNVPEEIKNIFYKLKGLELCPNLAGQLSMDLLVRPPTRYDSSEETVSQYNKEKTFNFENLKKKANLLSEKLNKMHRFSSNRIQGAMYAFPKIDFPNSVITKAEERGLKPDVLYSLELLNNTGIIVVPGSGFGQKDGTYHVRLTNLVNPAEEMVSMLDKVDTFNREFLG